VDSFQDFQAKIKNGKKYILPLKENVEFLSPPFAGGVFLF